MTTRPWIFEITVFFYMSWSGEYFNFIVVSIFLYFLVTALMGVTLACHDGVIGTIISQIFIVTNMKHQPHI